MAKTETEGIYGLPRDTTTISDELQQVLHDMGPQDANKTITLDFALRYARKLTACVNE